MSAGSSVLEDGTFLSKIDQRLFRLEAALALAGGLAVFSLMLLAVVSVGGRNFFNAPLPGYVDWIEQMMPLIAFIGVAYCQRLGGHIRMDIFISHLHGRSLWLFELVGTILMLILVILMIWGSWAHFERSFDFAAPLWSRDSSLDIRLPLWPAKLLVPVAFGVLAARLLLQSWGYARALAGNLPNPAAVPLILDAAALATEEAQHVSGADEAGDATEAAER